MDILYKYWQFLNNPLRSLRINSQLWLSELIFVCRVVPPLTQLWVRMSSMVYRSSAFFSRRFSTKSMISMSRMLHLSLKKSIYSCIILWTSFFLFLSINGILPVSIFAKMMPRLQASIRLSKLFLYYNISGAMNGNVPLVSFPASKCF